jgi:hypothetical protein
LLSLSFILCASSMMMYFHSSLLSLFLCDTHNHKHAAPAVVGAYTFRAKPLSHSS